MDVKSAFVNRVHGVVHLGKYPDCQIKDFDPSLVSDKSIELVCVRGGCTAAISTIFVVRSKILADSASIGPYMLKKQSENAAQLWLGAGLASDLLG